MATYYTLDALGVGPGDITPMSRLRNTPPPETPFSTITQHLRNNPVLQASEPATTENWDGIVKTPEKLDTGGPGFGPGGMA